jgi:putative transposase
LKLASEMYSTIRWADLYFRERDGKWLTQTELTARPELEEARRGVPVDTLSGGPTSSRSLLRGQGEAPGLYATFLREKKAHKYYSLVYPQSRWKILKEKDIRVK